jgi:tRNA (cytidine/uridine-2'-O-)-methyltransferase
MDIVLYEPQIPPNTGNIARLCAATGIRLHLIGPLGFKITDRHLKRAGLDYWDHVNVQVHHSLRAFLATVPRVRVFFFSKRAGRSYVQARFPEDSVLVFGSETAGLPEWVFEEYSEQLWSIPMFNPAVRSLNLSSAVAVVTYEALRQMNRL